MMLNKIQPSLNDFIAQIVKVTGTFGGFSKELKFILLNVEMDIVNHFMNVDEFQKKAKLLNKIEMRILNDGI